MGMGILPHAEAPAVFPCGSLHWAQDGGNTRLKCAWHHAILETRDTSLRTVPALVQSAWRRF